MNKLIAVLPGEGNVVTVPCSPHGETRLEVWGPDGCDPEADNGTVVFNFGEAGQISFDTPNVCEVRDGVVCLGGRHG
jgi:hypothetical protein